MKLNKYINYAILIVFILSIITTVIFGKNVPTVLVITFILLYFGLLIGKISVKK